MAGRKKTETVEAEVVETAVVPAGKMEFRLINPTEDGFLRRIQWNKEELEAAVRAKIAGYENVVYTEENIKAAKNDRAQLNKPPEPETAAGSDENGEGEEIPDNVVEAAKRRLGRSGANGNKVHTAKANTQGKDTGQSRSPTQT